MDTENDEVYLLNEKDGVWQKVEGKLRLWMVNAKAPEIKEAFFSFSLCPVAKPDQGQVS